RRANGDAVVTEAHWIRHARRVVVRVRNRGDRLIRGDEHRVFGAGDKRRLDTWVDESRRSWRDRACDGRRLGAVVTREARGHSSVRRTEVLHNEGDDPSAYELRDVGQRQDTCAARQTDIGE